MNRIKEERKGLRLSQTELADHLDVSQQTVCNWETQECAPSIEKLGKLRELFGCSLDWLLGFSNVRQAVDEDDRPAIAERIRAERTSQGWSQRELADLLGVSNASLQYYEHGTRLPRSDTIKAMSKLFGCTADYLLGLTEKRV